MLYLLCAVQLSAVVATCGRSLRMLLISSLASSPMALMSRVRVRRLGTLNSGWKTWNISLVAGWSVMLRGMRHLANHLVIASLPLSCTTKEKIKSYHVYNIL